jgi:plastocyanin
MSTSITPPNHPSPVRRRRLRRPRSAILAVAGPILALVVAACSSAAGAAGYTYPPTGTPPMSMPAASGPTGSAPATPAGPGPSTPASAGPGPSASAPASAATVQLSAQNIQFDTDHLAAPAGQGWVLEFANNDPGIPHNVEILDANGASVFKGEVVTGPTTTSYQVPALAAGSYTFLCDVHPTMTGTLTVA